jgi:hypothetical protein
VTTTLATRRTEGDAYPSLPQTNFKQNTIYLRPKVKNSYTERHRNGKGSRPRPSIYTQQYKDNYDEIFRKKKEDRKEEKKE